MVDDVLLRAVQAATRKLVEMLQHPLDSLGGVPSVTIHCRVSVEHFVEMTLIDLIQTTRLTHGLPSDN